MSTETLPELDAELVERTAKAIGRARLESDHPGDPVISDAGFELYWRKVFPEYRSRLRQQAVAALRGSELLKRVEELEQRIKAARWELSPQLGGVRDLSERIRRVDRVLAKPLPEPEPISIKP